MLSSKDPQVQGRIPAVLLTSIPKTEDRTWDTDKGTNYVKGLIVWLERNAVERFEGACVELSASRSASKRIGFFSTGVGLRCLERHQDSK